MRVFGLWAILYIAVSCRRPRRRFRGVAVRYHAQDRKRARIVLTVVSRTVHTNNQVFVWRYGILNGTVWLRPHHPHSKHTRCGGDVGQDWWILLNTAWRVRACSRCGVQNMDCIKFVTCTGFGTDDDDNDDANDGGHILRSASQPCIFSAFRCASQKGSYENATRGNYAHL